MVFLTQLPKEQLFQQLQNGVILMMLGMGTVFVFLSLLVFLTKGMSAIARKIAPAKSTAAVKSPATTAAAVAPSNDAEIAAAIVAAFAKSKE